MSKISFQPNAVGSGTFTIASPNSGTNRTLTLPDETGTVLTAASSLAAANLTGTVASERMPAGSVLQVVEATRTSAISFSSSSYSSAGLSVTVTPKRVDSKFIIQIWGRTDTVNTTLQAAHDHRVLRDAVVVNRATWQSYFNRSTTASDIYPPFDVTYIDTPATLSAITYSLEGRIYGGSNGGWIFAANNGGYSFGIMTITEIAQ